MSRMMAPLSSVFPTASTLTPIHHKFLQSKILAPMLEKLDVPTRQPKEFLKRYFTDDAFYSHVEAKQKKKHTPHFNNILCKFFAKDNCNRGNDCIFSHNAAQFPCADLVENNICHRAQCQFKHDIALPSRTRQTSAAQLTGEKNIFISPFMQ